MLPGSASAPKVAPSILRTMPIAPGASTIMTTTGVLVMNFISGS